MTIQIIDMPDDQKIQHVVARTCVEYWQRDFPLDTDKWYLDLYQESVATNELPIVLVALLNGEFVGTGALITDDELPGAYEPGPWVAAVYVTDAHRQQGIGTSLVQELQRRARTLGLTEIFLYTEYGDAWYESMGWRSRRTAQLSGHNVTVMSCDVQATG